MSNEIEINGITISAYDYLGAVVVSFRKGGKIIKTVSASDIDKVVRPENREAVKALAATVKIREITRESIIAAESYEERICREAQERRDNRTAEEKAAHQADMDAIDAHQARMARTMSVQG